MINTNEVTVVILAGGEGSRIRPFSKITPKPLLPAHDTPLVVRQLKQASKAGFNRIIVSTNKSFYNKIRAVLTRFGFENVAVVANPEHRYGSLPALVYIMNSLKTEKVIMSFADIFFFKNPYLALKRGGKNKNQPLLGVSIASKGEDLSSGGIIFCDKSGKVLRLIEKPLKGNKHGFKWNGLALFDVAQKDILKKFLTMNPKNSPEGDFFDYLIIKKKLNHYAFVCSDFINVNKFMDLLKATSYRISELLTFDK